MEENVSLPDFCKIEEEILKKWSELNAFKTTLEQSRSKKKYTFYDGPPFATGLPHYGHILAGTIKDIVTRYAHQTGHHVERRFGWDCHGVPVEHQIDKKFNISGPDDVEKMGIANYNNACRSIVTKYSNEWETTVSRIGRWIDFENDYKTMYPWFMESVWHVFKIIYEKGLVYRGFKVMPFSTGCNTPLSNFESRLNFNDVSDPVVVVTFPLLNDNTVSFMAWTTTPWTLPSNLALCVNSESDYVKVMHEKSKKIYILMEARLNYVFKKDKIAILEKFKGKTLENLEYVPLFNYFLEHREANGAFRVLCDNYVTSESGTGIVHQSPYFGEDDYRVCMNYGIITKNSKIVCPVDATGSFEKEVVDFAGMYVKSADEKIVKHLKEAGRLFSSGRENHSYPFCYRSETPLIYKAVGSWFIKVESIVNKLIESNDRTYWVPDFVKTNRFGNWLKDARDWAFSRNRYWGTPIPLWVSDDFEEVVCIGSIEELERLTGAKVSDLHKENIDHLLIPSKRNNGYLKRVPEVFDCWFESGSMPYAQSHFPFTMSPEKFNEIFPADFIAEGLDQTRGWFYTLTVIGTILFGKSPFKNVIVNGIVLAGDGQKMSKSKQNYPDPMEVVNKNGADALRLYLINSPVVRAQNLKFVESGVFDIKKDVFGPWYNASKFLINSSLVLMERKMNGGKKMLFKPDCCPISDNVLDKWIVSVTQSLLKFISQQMADYRLDTVIPRLIKYIDQLTNWYVKMNRKRLQGESVSSDKDWLTAVHTLFFVMYQITLVMCPFVPFITEYFYQIMKDRIDFSERKHELTVGINEDGVPDSVHYLMLPNYDEKLIDSEIEEIFSVMQTVVETGRKIRDREKFPLKWPLQEAVVLAQDLVQIKANISAVEDYVLEGLNIKKLTLCSDLDKYGVKLRGILNHRELGAKLKNDYKAVVQRSRELTNEELEEFKKCGSIKLCGHVLEKDDMEVVVSSGDDKTSGNYRMLASDDGIIVALDCKRTESLVHEGVAREVRSRIQRRRKELMLIREDPVRILCWSDDQQLRELISEYYDLIYSVVQEPIEVRATHTDCDLEVCSLLNDTVGCECEVRMGEAGDKVVKLKLWFFHDHSRVTKDNRSCSTATPNSVEKSGVNNNVKEQDIKMKSDELAVIRRDSGEHVLLNVSDICHFDDVKRIARLKFGWTSFVSNDFMLYDSEGNVIKKGRCDQNCLSGKMFYL